MSGDASKWLEIFFDASIDSIQKLQHIFFDKWDEKKDIIFVLNTLTSIKRKENELF